MAVTCQLFALLIWSYASGIFRKIARLFEDLLNLPNRSHSDPPQQRPVLRC